MRLIPLTQGKFAIVDDEDYDYLSQFKWSVTSTGYAHRNAKIGLNKRRYIKMHAVVAQTPQGMETDHINRNRLDNRKSNLRICTHTENMRNQTKHKNNKSGFKGVYWHPGCGCYKAQIKHHGVIIQLGGFQFPEDAHAAYVKAALKYHGDFALA